MTVTLGDIPQQPRDEAFALTADFKADNHPNKVSLSAGVYRDGNSKPWVLSSVREVGLTLIHRVRRLKEFYMK
jgi:aspartate/tyrosine/aromatic aminotransferase